MFTFTATSALCTHTHTHTQIYIYIYICACYVHFHRTAPNCYVTTQRTSRHLRQGWWLSCFKIRQNVHRKRRCKYIHNSGTDTRTEGPVGDLFRTCQGYDLLKMGKLPDTTFKMAVPTLTTATDLSNNLRRLTSSLPQAYQQELVCCT